MVSSRKVYKLYEQQETGVGVSYLLLVFMASLSSSWTSFILNKFFRVAKQVEEFSAEDDFHICAIDNNSSNLGHPEFHLPVNIRKVQESSITNINQQLPL